MKGKEKRRRQRIRGVKGSANKKGTQSKGALWVPIGV
jgi:hypothetical protein